MLGETGGIFFCPNLGEHVPHRERNLDRELTNPAGEHLDMTIGDDLLLRRATIDFDG